MKQLQTIQKGMRIFEMVTKFFLVISIGGAVLATGGLMAVGTWNSGGSIAGLDAVAVQNWIGASGMNELIASLVDNFVMAITSVILCLLAGQYFKAEQADGTPFSDRGAYLLRRLGIIHIVLSLAGGMICGIVKEVVQAKHDGWGDGDSLVIGFILILLSCIFQYGAELKNRSQIGNEHEN